MENIIIAHQTITDGDAIGHDIMGMYDLFTSLGYKVYICGEYCFEHLKSAQIKPINIKQFSVDDLLIYHHSIHWKEGERLLSNFKGKIIFRYHNITPPYYFRGFSDIHYQKCLQGIEQTKAFINLYNNSLWLGASEFNCLELHDHGLNPKMSLVVPPFNLLDNLKDVYPNFRVIDELIGSYENNVLFVGRVAPNKGHYHLIKTIKTYKDMYDSKIHLWIIGALDNNCRPYNEYISKLILKSGLGKNISMTGKVSIEDLKAYYLACDEFLCMSEHEGFCVPLIEAQKMLLPVITYGGSALEETAGKNQIVMNDFDYEFAAAALYTIFSDEKVRTFCNIHGIQNCTSRFSSNVIKNKFISALNMPTEGETV